MTRLRDVGCRIAIDDFGAGHTSFRSLYELQFDAVKIDGMYVQNLSEFRRTSFSCELSPNSPAT